MVKKSIEETYKKLSQREHVLQRSGMYVGSTKKQMEEMWVLEGGKIVRKIVEYTPAFLKIFDEVLTNATDHSTRDISLDKIRVDLNKETGIISVWNNGRGIPVVMHKEHNMYVPELIFGQLLSGSNYDDSQRRTGAGMNGLGIKIVLIFSKNFVVETVDEDTGLKFVQEYTDNMTNKKAPKITKNSGKGYTKISFMPDYERFQMEGLDDDTVALIGKRVYDCVACTNKSVAVHLNGERIKGKGLTDYINYYFDDPEKVIYESFEINDIVWEYAVVPNEKFEHVSFVNGNSTYAGGRHVDYITNQVVNKLKAMIESKRRLKDIKPSFIKEKIFLFLRATVVNPSFSSQTKEYLTTQWKDFGTKVEVSDKFIEKLYKSSITEDVMEFCKLKETAELSKQDGKKRSKVYIPKLEDALWAGTYRSSQCILILTEGDSAKTFAMWGRSIVGTDRFGVFPLKGKCISEDTKIPLFNGEIKCAKDIQKGDIVIGDDGNPRNVLTLYKGNGEMYEVSQDRGESYKVNDEHILTLCMPEHKQIFWVPSNYTWRALYWDKETKNIKAKESRADIKIACKECETMISTKCIRKHYKRKHKNVKYVPYKLENKQMNDTQVVHARKRLEEILLSIDDNNVIDICIQDYLNVTKSLQRKLKGIRGECVNWKHKDVLLDPYVLGLWLGDGMKSGYGYTCFEEKDPEIMDYLHKWGKENDARFTKSSCGKYKYNISSIENFRKMGEAPLKKVLSEYNLVNNKHIPKEYLVNSREVRLHVLAGIIDTDGYITSDGTIEIAQSVPIHQQLVEDIVYLSRSLGFYAYVSEKQTNYVYKDSGERAIAYRIKISGDTSIIPTLLPRKQSKSTSKYNMRNSTGTIQIKKIKDENYVGIGIDGNNRFLINDFTITHNCLNVRDASVQQLVNNEEINNLKQILGLKQGKEYTDTQDLRYGKVMLLTDSDVDGSHIKALIMNMFHYWWPSLFKMDFLQTLKTPIVKATRGKTSLEFFTQGDYNKWLETVGSTRGYNIKYFKGLGTSSRDDAQSLFRRMSELLVNYKYQDDKCDNAILLAFEKDKNTKNVDIKCSDKRKTWLSNYDKDVYLDVKQSTVTYQDFIHKDLIHFSIYDNLRSIPCLCDGFKPSQRKIMYYMLKENILHKEIKVAQLSGYVSAETSYHHGEASLQQAIIGMAQDFCGSNNLNLIKPEGNHGSRFGGGKDAASSRYIFTRMMQYTPLIFHPDDSPLLTFLEDDGQRIEPEWYMPVIPMVLVNGCEGIGTGYSTFIPPHNPRDIIANLLLLLDNKDAVPMMPWYRGFRGEIQKTGEGTYVSKGRWKKIAPGTVEITELPVGTWITAYKEFLESCVDGGAAKGKRKIALKDVKNLTTDENSDIKFVVQFEKDSDLEDLIGSEMLESTLKLTKSFSSNNMYLFDDVCGLRKYSTTTDILLDFYDIRLDCYEQRKAYLLKQVSAELKVLKAKIKFIEEYISGKLDINRKSKEIILQLLETRGFPKHPEHQTYEYLTSMTIMSFSKEKIQELTTQFEKRTKYKNELISKTPQDLWREDLDAVSTQL